MELKTVREDLWATLDIKKGYRKGANVPERGEHLGGIFASQPLEYQGDEVFQALDNYLHRK
jgi:hypothetical protein